MIKMAGSLATVETDRHEKENAVNNIIGQWQVHFARFMVHPSRPSSTCPSLVLTKSRRYRGTWIATSSPSASLQIINHHLSHSKTIITVSLNGKILEEHYISKLHFSWPQVQCIPEIPGRGSRAVFVSYKDCASVIQKFALRFSTLHEAGSFMNALMEKFKNEVGFEPLNMDFGSDLSPQSDFISSNGIPNRANQELSDMNPDASYTPHLFPSLSYESRQQSFDQDVMLNNNAEGSYEIRQQSFDQDVMLNNNAEGSYEIRQHSFDQDVMLNNNAERSYEIRQQSFDQDVMLNNNSEGTYSPFPPSFTSLLTDCCSTARKDDVAANQPTVSEEIDLKSQIARYMEDSSFQDMLTKVEKIISEVGGDLLL